MNDGTVRLRETKQRNHKWLYRIQYQSGQQCFDYQSYRNRAFQTAKRFGLEINEPVSTTIDKTVHWNCSPNTSNGVSTASWTFSRKSTCTLSTAFYKDTCHARNHLPASPHRNSEFTSRQHGRTRTQLTSKYRPGKEAVSYYYNYDLYNKWHTGYGWNRQIPSSCNK